MEDVQSPQEQNNVSTKNKSFALITAVVVMFLAIGVGAFILFKPKTQNQETSTQQTIQDTESKTALTMTEVQKHSTKAECWLVIDNVVYDVTKFIPRHPGGEYILSGCGKDATSFFNSRPTDGKSHSDKARSMLSGYELGPLVQNP